MECERGDVAEDLGRDAPEQRQAAGRAAATIVLRREHRGELVEVAALVVCPAAQSDAPPPTPKPTTTLPKGGKADKDEDESDGSAALSLSLATAVAALFAV